MLPQLSVVMWYGQNSPRVEGEGSTSVSEPRFAGCADHHYCISSVVSNTNVEVSVLIEVFGVITTRRIKWFTPVVPLNILIFCVVHKTHDFCLIIIITVHYNQCPYLLKFVDVDLVVNVDVS